MKKWIVYDKGGGGRCEVKSLTYNGEFMGSCSVNITVTSPTPIGFELGDWIEYRGERFELNYDPTVIKESSMGSCGDAFVYENVVFNSLSDELTRCSFLDYVKNDNNIHYSSLPKFSFFADSIEKLAERIEVNLDRIYTADDGKKWTVEVHPEYVNTKSVNVNVQNNTVWEALAFVNTLFDTNFIIRGRKITIGTTGLAVGKLFAYGKDSGLFKIEKNADSSQQVITRLRAYGSTRNMPNDYYLNLEGGDVPNNMAVKNLMLPSFPYGTLDPYLQSENASKLGIREGVVFFDGSNENEEIYPTMEGMTAESLKASGVNVNATGALDVIVSAEQITDNGKAPEEGSSEKLELTFKVYLKDIGFDINDYLSTEGGATLSMKSGKCSGREFDIVECKEISGGYELTCNRALDEGLDLYFPYNDYQIEANDKFVLLNIEMPDVYIEAASQRLQVAAEAYLSKNDYVRYTYIPTVDNIYLARQHENAEDNREKSIYENIKEGDLMLFDDEDLGINGSVTISSLIIKEDLENSLIPEYEIVLQDKKSVGTLQKLQNQIANLASLGGGGDTITIDKSKTIIEAVGSALFLSKIKDDRSKGTISSDKGFEVGKFNEGILGSGAAMYQDKAKNTYIEADFLRIRKKATFTNITVQELKHVGGEIVISPAAMICFKVEELSDGWKCYFNKEDSDGRKIYNEFEVGDQARCQIFNLEPNADGTLGSRYYWRLVTGVGEDYIVLSKTDCDSRSDAPMVGDNIVQLGNRNDPQRQSAIVISAYGEDSPSYKQYDGIKSYSMAEANLRTKFSPKGNLIEGDFISKSGKNLGAEFDSLKVDFDAVLAQSDRQFTMWFYDYAPSNDRLPESEWTSDDIRRIHVEDLFYCTKEDADIFGKVWRYIVKDSLFVWEEVTDATTIAAMKTAANAQETAANAQETADSKIRNFITEANVLPAPPYDKGDRWCNAAYEPNYDNDDLVCVTAKGKGDTPSIGDWRPASIMNSETKRSTEAAIKNLGDQVTINATAIGVHDTAISSLSVKVDSVELSVAGTKGDIEDAKELAEAAKDVAVTAALTGMYSGEEYNQTNNPWQTWPSGEEHKHVGAIWYNPSTETTSRYIGYDDTNTWEDVSNDRYESATFVFQNKNKWSAISASFDDEGNLTNTSGFMTVSYYEESFAGMFAEALDKDEMVVKRAEMGAYVTKDEDGYIETGVIIRADNVDINNGVVIIDSDSAVIGGFDIMKDEMTGGEGIKMHLKISDSEYNYPSIRWKDDVYTYSSIGAFDNSGYRSGQVYLFSSAQEACTIIPSNASIQNAYYWCELGVSNNSSFLNMTQKNNASNRMSMKIDNSGAFSMYSPSWSKEANVTVGWTYVDGSGYLKVKK